jgi:hypothetical protein
MGTRKRIIHENHERFRYKGLEGPHAYSTIKADLFHGRDGPGFFIGQEEGG